MSVARLELQKAIVARLRADGAVAAIVGQRVYDKPPASPAFPYTSLGPRQTLPNDGSCEYRGEEHHIQIDTWSRAVGMPETESLNGAIRASLHYAAISLTGFRLTHISVESDQGVNDPDGLTQHGILAVQAFTEPSA